MTDVSGVRIEPAGGGRAGRHVAAGVLLAVTFVALLWVPSYAKVTPTLGGIPFFYWYSVLWLVINAACQVIAYRIIARRPAEVAR